MQLPAVLALGLLVSPALAQAAADVPHREDVRAAWQQFQRAHPGAWQVEWSPATGTPRAIWGPGLELGVGAVRDAELAARLGRRVLRDHATLLGVGASEFVEDIAQQVGRVHVLVYRQRFRGLRVLDGRADVRVHEVGAVSLFGANAMPVPADFDVTPRIEPDRARALAGLGLRLDPPPQPEIAPPVPELVVWADRERVRTPVRLAWEVTIDRSELATAVVGRAYIDARNGRLLQFRTDRHECFGDCRHVDDGAVEPAASTAAGSGWTAAVRAGEATSATNVIGNVTGWVNIDTDPTSALTNVPLRGLRVQVAGGNTALTDANGDFDIPHGGTAPVTLTIDLSFGRRSGAQALVQGTPITVAVPATPGVAANVTLSAPSAGQFDRAQMDTFWWVDSVNEYCRGVIGSLPMSMDTIDANLNLTSRCNAFYSGNSINFYARGGGCVNTAFSTVIDHEWGHGLDDRYGGISTTDGLSEGWADIVANYHTGNPIVGEGFSGPGTNVRTATNRLTYPAGGGVHTQGMTWMGWAWDVRLNLIQSLGTTAGVARAEQIVLASIVADADSQPIAVREVFVLDDDDANLNNGTPHCNELARACNRRNLPNPTLCTGSTVPGAYAVFGSGCAGSGLPPTLCVRLNENLANRGLSVGASLTYAIRFTPTTDLDVDGYELFTAFPGGTSVPAFLFDDVGGQPGNPLASGTLTVGNDADWYAATFSSPIRCRAGQPYYFGYRNGPTAILASIVSGGTSTPYFRDAGGIWRGPFQGVSWAYRIRCVTTTGAVPELAHASFPEIDTRFDLRLTRALENGSAALLTGVSKTTYGPLTLPYAMDPLGAPGCTLLSSAEIVVPVSVGPLGDATVSQLLPNDSRLVGVVFHNQFAVFDPANALGVVVTNAGTGTIGMP